MDPGAGIATSGFGSALAGLASDFWLAIVGIAETALQALRSLAMAFVSNPIAFLFLLLAFLFVIPWVPYHHMGLAYLQTGYSCVVQPLVDDVFLPVARAFAPVYEAFAKVWNAVLFVPVHLRNDFLLTIIRCKATTEVVSTFVKSVSPIARATTIVAGMAGDVLVGRSSNYSAAQYAVGLSFGAVANLTDVASGVLACFCAPGAYWFDVGVVILRDDSVRCTTSTAIAAVQEFFASWFRSLYRFLEWCIRAVAWIVCRVFQNAFHTSADCGEFPPFYASEILPKGERLFELAEAATCCAADLTDEVGNSVAIAALEIGNLTWWLPNVGGTIGPHFAVPTNAKYGTPIRILLPVFETIRLLWSTFGRLLDTLLSGDPEPDFSGLEAERLYDAMASTCANVADGAESFGQLERFAAIAFTDVAMPVVGLPLPWIPFVYGPRAMNHSCLAIVELGRAMAGVLAEVRTYEDYRTGRHFDCVLRELRLAVEHAVNDSAELLSMIPAWKTCRWTVADEGEFPVPFYPPGIRPPVMRCEESVFGREIGMMLTAPADVAVSIIEYAVDVSEHLDTADQARRVSTDCIFDACVRNVRAMGVVFSEAIDQIPGSVADGQTLIGVTQSGVDALVDFLPFSAESEEQLHELTNETLGRLIEFLGTIPYATAEVYVPTLGETRTINLVDLVPVVFPVRTIPPVVTEASVALIEILRFVAATIHTGDFDSWEFDPAVLERLITQQAILANVTARAIVQPMCLVREVIESEGCADWMWLNSTAFNVSICLPTLLPCPEEALAALLRSDMLLLDAVAQSVLYPSDFTENLFDRPLCELETASYELGQAFDAWDIRATIPFWDTELEIDGAVLASSVGYAAAKMLGLANKLVVEAIKATLDGGYGYEWAPGCNETHPSRIDPTHCDMCVMQSDPDERCPDGTFCCSQDGKCGSRCFDGLGLKNEMYSAVGALASLSDALAGASGFVDPYWSVVVGESTMIAPATLKAIFDVALLPTIDPEATYADGAAELTCAARDLSKAAASFFAIPISVGGHLASALFEVVGADETSANAADNFGYLASQTARVVDAYGRVAIESAGVALTAVGMTFDLGSEQKTFLEYLSDAADGICRVEEALEELPNATGEFVRALDVTGNNLTCEVGGLAASMVDLATTTVTELLGIVGSVTEAPNINRGINASKIVDKIKIVAAESASALSGIAYDFFSLVVQDEDARHAMREVFDNVAFFLYAIVNVGISFLSSAANAFGILMSAFSEVSDVFDAFCGVSTESFDVLRPILKAVTTLMQAFASLIQYVSESIAEFVLALANLIEMFFEDEDSAIFKFVQSFFDTVFAFVDLLLSFFSGDDVGTETLQFLQAFYETVESVSTILLDLIIGFIDEFIFGGIELADRGVVECILDLGDCVEDLIGDLFGLATRTSEDDEDTCAPASSTMILAMAHMFPEGDSCVNTFVSAATLVADREAEIAECVEIDGKPLEECESVAKMVLLGYRLVWRASLCLERFVRKGYGEPYGLYFDAESGTTAWFETRDDGDDSDIDSASSEESVDEECSTEEDGVCRFDEIDGLTTRIETTISMLLTAAADPDGILVGAEKVVTAAGNESSSIDVEFLAALLSRGASDFANASATLIRRAIVISHFGGDESDVSTRQVVDAVMQELGGYLDLLHSTMSAIKTRSATRSARSDAIARDPADVYSSVRYVREVYGGGNGKSALLLRESPATIGDSSGRLDVRLEDIDDYREDECGHVVLDMAGVWGEPGRFDAPCPVLCPNCEDPAARFDVASLCPIDACPDVLADHPELRAACARVCDSAAKSQMFEDLCVDTLADLSDGSLDDVQEVWEVRSAFALTLAGYRMVVDVGDDDTETWTISSADLKKILDVDGDDGPLLPADVCTDVGRYGHPSSEFCSSRCDVNLETSLVYRVFRGGQSGLLSDYGRIFLTYVCRDFCAYHDPTCKNPQKVVACPPSLTSSLTCLHTCDVVYAEDAFSSTDPVPVPETCRTTTRECTPLSPGLDAVLDSSCRCPPDWYEPTIANVSEVCLCTYDLSGTSNSYVTSPYNVVPFLCPNTARRGVYHYFDDMAYQDLSASMRVKISNEQYTGFVKLIVYDSDDAEAATEKADEDYPIEYPPMIGLASEPIDAPTIDNVHCEVEEETVVHQACGTSFECATLPPVYCTEETICESWTDYSVVIAEVDEFVTETRTLYPHWSYPIWHAIGNMSEGDCFDTGSVGRCNDTICLPGSTYLDPLGPECDPDLHCARGTFCPASDTCDAWAIGRAVEPYTDDFDFFRENDYVFGIMPHVTTLCYVKKNCTYGGNWCVDARTFAAPDPSECPVDSTLLVPEPYLTEGLRTFRLYGYGYKCFNSSEPCYDQTVGCVANVSASTCEDVFLCQRVRACPAIHVSCFNATWCPRCEYCELYGTCDACATACSETDVCARITVCANDAIEYHQLCAYNTTAGCRDVEACSGPVTTINETGVCVTTQKPANSFPGVLQLTATNVPYPWTFASIDPATCDIPWVDTGHFCSYLCDDGTGLDTNCYEVVASGINCTWYLDETNVPNATSYGPAAARKWFCRELNSEVPVVGMATFPIVGAGQIYPDQVRTITTIITGMQANACPSRYGKWTNITAVSISSPSTPFRDACIMLAPDPDDDSDPTFGGVVEQLPTADCDKLRRYVENTYVPAYGTSAEKYMSGSATCPSPHYFDIVRYRDRPMVGCEPSSASPDLPHEFDWDTSPYLDRVSVGGFVGNDDPDSPYYVRSISASKGSGGGDRRRRAEPAASLVSHLWLVNEVKDMMDAGMLGSAESGDGDRIARATLMARYGDPRSIEPSSPELVEEAYEIFREFRSIEARFVGGCEGRSGECPPGPNCTIERAFAEPCADWPYANETWTACEPREYQCRYSWRWPCETWLAEYLVVLSDEDLAESLVETFARRDVRSDDRPLSPFGSLVETASRTGAAIASQVRDAAETSSRMGEGERSLISTMFRNVAPIRLYNSATAHLDLAACASMPWSKACGRISRWEKTASRDDHPNYDSIFAELKSARATKRGGGMSDAIASACRAARDGLLPPLESDTVECFLLCGYDWNKLFERSCVWQATPRDGPFGEIFDALNAARLSTCDALDIGNGSSLFVADLSDYIPNITLVPFREPSIGSTGWSGYVNITHTSSFSPYATSTEPGRFLYQLETIAANLVSCVFGVDVNDLESGSFLLSFGASVLGFDNATEFQTALKEWLGNFNLYPDEGEVGALYWGLLLSPFGANCASINGTHKIFDAIPVYSPLWWSTVIPLPYLPTWVGNASVAVFEWISEHEFVVPDSMVIDPSGCANVTDLCIPLTRSCDCYPSFENCGERLGFATVQDYVYMLLDLAWPGAPNATLPRLIAAFTGTTAYLEKYADVRNWEDFCDRAYCLGVVGIPWMLWWVVVGAVGVAVAYFFLRLLIALLKFLFLLALALAIFVVMAGSGATPPPVIYGLDSVDSEYWDEASERWMPLEIRPRVASP